MDLKKITALAMLALLTLPSLTMVVRADDPTGNPEDGAGLASAIARARLYLGKVRTLADNIDVDELYPDNEDIQGYLNQIYELLGRYDGEDPEILLQAGTNGIAERSDVKSNSGTYSVHLDSNDVSPGDEARIVISMPSGFTLGDLDTLSWWVYTDSGYPPHVDITLDTLDSDQSMLTAELAVNNPSYSPPTYGTYDTWLETFEMASADGYDEIDDTTILWVTKMGAGDQDAPSSTLTNWKLGTIDNDPGSELPTTEISSMTLVLKLEIEVDNWIVESEAYIDDIKIDGVTYDFEEEEEEAGKAKYYLDQASAYLNEGKFNSSARNLAAARNILGRVKGLLTRIAKAHKVTRTERFMEQVRRRIEGIEAKVERLKGRLGESGTDNMMASMGLAKGKLRQLDANLTGNNVDSIIDGLEDTTEIINEGFEELEEDETSNTLEAIDRLEAKIRVLKASAERLSGKGYDTAAVVYELKEAEALLSEIMESLKEENTKEAEDLLEEAEELVSRLSDNIRAIRKEHQNKGSKGKGKGQGH